MTSTKAKAFAATIGTTIILAITIITICVWPQDDKNFPDSDEPTDSQTDNSRFSLINLHYKVNSHTLITTSTFIASTCTIIIIIVFKEIVMNRRRKKQRTSMQMMSRGSYPMEYTSSTWMQGIPRQSSSNSYPDLAMQQNIPRPYPDMPATSWSPDVQQPYYYVAPHPQARTLRKEHGAGETQQQGQAMAVVHGRAPAVENKDTEEENSKLGSKWRT